MQSHYSVLLESSTVPRSCLWCLNGNQRPVALAGVLDAFAIGRIDVHAAEKVGFLIAVGCQGSTRSSAARAATALHAVVNSVKFAPI